MNAPTAEEEQEAVFLFEDNRLTREMLYPEFEAILDGFIPVPDYARQTVRVVYVRIDVRLCIRAAVFFLIEFDEKGMIDRSWNVPLQQLAATAAKGPDMGAGPIRLACFSQCPIAWQQKNLWDPHMEAALNHFVVLRKAVAANRLRLVFKTAAKEEARKKAETRKKAEDTLAQKIQQKYARALRDRMAHQIKEHRLRITTLNTRAKRRLQALQLEHQQRIHAYQERLHKEQQGKAELDARVELLKENLETQTQKIDGLREYYSHKLETRQSSESAQLQAMQESYELEMTARLDAAIATLQERLDLREMELLYRHQQEANLREEIARLQGENQRLLATGGDQLLPRLQRAGISFVAFHPGVGHINLAPTDMSLYLKNPQAFAAQKCGVSESLYTAWLEHYENPLCLADPGDGSTCGVHIARVGAPGDFLLGESDRCEQHQAISLRRVVEQG